MNMSARRPVARNNHLEEAMALLIRNQAAFVEQIARNDQERLALKEWQQETQEWQRRAEVRFDNIEQRLANIEASLIQLPKTILQQLPKAVKKEIGFKTPTYSLRPSLNDGHLSPVFNLLCGPKRRQAAFRAKSRQAIPRKLRFELLFLSGHARVIPNHHYKPLALRQHRILAAPESIH